jgi:UDP-N-acetyl-D-mannosaminuronic acid dehydrogenase
MAVEPNIETLPQKLSQPNLTLSKLDDALEAADVVCVLVKHKLFIELVEDIRRHGRATDVVGLFS